MTIFGMICTDAYLGYKLEHVNMHHGGNPNPVTYKVFLFRLAYQLIYQLKEEKKLRTRKRGDEDSSDDDDDDGLRQKHNLIPLSQTAYYSSLKDEVNKKKRAVRRATSKVAEKNCLPL